MNPYGEIDEDKVWSRAQELAVLSPLTDKYTQILVDDLYEHLLNFYTRHALGFQEAYKTKNAKKRQEFFDEVSSYFYVEEFFPVLLGIDPANMDDMGFQRTYNEPTMSEGYYIDKKNEIKNKLIEFTTEDYNAWLEAHKLQKLY